ncbi:MAG: PTS sugar transporter subunit IIA [Planctomycetota bacterium]|nr:PTS sugar transporter subunit IIA [Planctomycetota bacterium]
MKISEIVPQGAIVPRLVSVERDDVVAEIMDALVAAGLVRQDMRKEMIDAVLERERRGSTGFGKGVAVPHVKHTAIPRMSAAIALSENGIDFNALDKQPVYSVILLLSPAGSPEEHLQAMEVIFKNLSQDKFRRFLRQATTVEDVRTLLEDADHHRLA